MDRGDQRRFAEDGGQNEEASFAMTIPTRSLCRAGGSLLALPPSPPAYLLMIPEVGNEGRRSEERESGLSFLSGRADGRREAF